MDGEAESLLGFGSIVTKSTKTLKLERVTVISLIL